VFLSLQIGRNRDPNSVVAI